MGEIQPGIGSQDNKECIDAFTQQELYRLLDRFASWEKRVSNHEWEWKQAGSYEARRKDSDHVLQLLNFTFRNKVNNKDGLFIVAMNKDQQIIGFRNTSFSMLPYNVIKAEGNIEVLQRGKRVGKAIEALHMRLLQEKAQQNPDTPVEYIIDDDNDNHIKQLYPSKIKYAKTAEERADAEASLAKAIAQRPAWEKLYGEQGILGFTKEGNKLKKQFTKETQVPDLGYILKPTHTSIDLPIAIEHTLDQLHKQITY
jgi:hypothetical protein